MTWTDKPSPESIKAGYWTLLGIVSTVLFLVWISLYLGYQSGYRHGIASIRSEDMKELVSLRQKLEKSTSSIIILKCEQQKLIQHKLRKGKVKDSIMSERSMDASPETGNR